MAAVILCLPKKGLFLHRDLDLISGLTSSCSSFANCRGGSGGGDGEGEDGGSDWWSSSAIVGS